MTFRNLQRAIQWFLGAVLVFSCLPVFGAVSSREFQKTYAVFIAVYNPTTGEARGGVAGTAFFVSPTEAITAFHVIRPSTFTTQSPVEKKYVWLVHENEKPIAITSENATYFSDRDLTRIHIPRAYAVSEKFVFKNSPSTVLSINRIRTEGFVANSVGPTLTVLENRLMITHVPSLARIQSEGFLVRKARVDLQAQDVTHKATDCFQLSYQPIVGLSGGPVILGDVVIGMNSFADPTTRNQTWAVDINSEFNSILE